MIWLSEDYVDRSHGHSYGDCKPYETYFEDAEIGSLFLSLQREFGRCTGKMFIDRSGQVQHVGWVFEKRVQYSDCDEIYLREVWVTLYTAPSEPQPPIRHYRVM